MSKKVFTEQEIETLKQNKYVKRVSEKAITYTDELKHFAIAQWRKGVNSTQVFINAGFDPGMIGDYRVKSSMRRWKKAFKERGIMGLQDTRKGASGRPLERELSLEEQLEREKAKNKFLEFQLEFQKKLDMIERGVYIPKSKRKQK